MTETTAPDPDSRAVIDEAGRQLRAPWAASIAGLLFAILFSASMVLLRTSPLAGAGDDASVATIYAEGRELGLLVGGLYLAPFAGVMFLWFIAVIRDQIGEREDRFFATVFFGSGLLFVALLFVTAATISSVVVGTRYLGTQPPSLEIVKAMQALGYTFMFAFATRAAAVFLISLGTIGLRSRVFPRWFAVLSYLIGLVLLIGVAVWDWVVLVLPLWVAVVSVFILRRERGRRSPATGTPPPG